MTAPVTLLPVDRTLGSHAALVEAGETNGWVVRFTMPKAYAISGLPPPQDVRIRLRVSPPGRAAVVRFSGVAHTKDFEATPAELSAWMKRRALRATGPAAPAQYDPPWTLWFLRRNEVLIPVAAWSEAALWRRPRTTGWPSPFGRCCGCAR